MQLKKKKKRVVIRYLRTNYTLARPKPCDEMKIMQVSHKNEQNY